MERENRQDSADRNKSKSRSRSRSRSRTRNGDGGDGNDDDSTAGRGTSQSLLSTDNNNDNGNRKPPSSSSVNSAIVWWASDSLSVTSGGEDDDEEQAQNSPTSPTILIGTGIASPEGDTPSVHPLEHPITAEGRSEENGASDSSLSPLPFTFYAFRSFSPMEERGDENPTESTRMATIGMDDDELSSGASIPAPERIAIERVPRTNVSEQHVTDTSVCVICRELFQLEEEINEMECRHIFHPRCLFPWLNLSATCPVCRSPLPPA